VQLEVNGTGIFDRNMESARFEFGAAWLVAFRDVGGACGSGLNLGSCASWRNSKAHRPDSDRRLDPSTPPAAPRRV
jgi:hypothetical protein